MKRAITSVAAVAILTVAITSTSHAAWFGGVEVKNDMSKKTDNSVKAGRDMTQNSNNRTTTNRNDNRDYTNRSINTDSRDLSDHRDLSNRSTTVDSRNQSDSRVDSRNMSDQRQTTTIDSRDMSDRSVKLDNTRNQSHNFGDGSIVINGEGYKPRVGHENAGVSGMTGSNNYVDQSVSGNFGIGHTTLAPAGQTVQQK